jgi:hypothetical protein
MFLVAVALSVTLGVYDSPEAIEKALVAQHVRVNESVHAMFDEMDIASDQVTVPIAVVSVAELGFTKGATRSEVYRAAHERGLQLCPAEVGPLLRLQYAEQPVGEWLQIAMEPMKMLDGAQLIFRLGHTRAGSFLTIMESGDVVLWLPKDQFVFQVSRAASHGRGFCLHLPHENGRVIARHPRGGAGSGSSHHRQLAVGPWRTGGACVQTG